MDHEQRTLAATEQDPALAARIVRGIADIERDYHLASGPLSERLMREAVQAFGKPAPPTWKMHDSGWSALLVPPEWSMTRGVGKGDAWLELAEICGDEDNDYSWIAAAVSAGPTQMCVEIVCRAGLSVTALAAIRETKTVAPLLKLGFVRDEANERLLIPIEIATEALAIGFEQNDLDQALAPIGRAVELAILAKAELDRFLDQVREQAKRK